MALIKTNGSLFPKKTEDFFGLDFFRMPGILDFNGGLSKFEWPKFPSVNITENDKDYKLELAAPGLQKKDFKIEVENGLLTISSEKKKKVNAIKKDYRRREFSYQSFSRSFKLPKNLLTDKIDAHYENGVLKLILPKKEVTISKPKKEILVF